MGTNYIAIPVAGTVVRFDVLSTWVSDPEAITVNLKTSAFAVMASVTTAAQPGPSIASDTSIDSATVSVGSYLIFDTSVPTASSGNGKIRGTITVAI
jgi:hypothetical protein